MSADHHLLNWYDRSVNDFAKRVSDDFDIELSLEEMVSIRDALYTAVNDAKVRLKVKE